MGYKLSYFFYYNVYPMDTISRTRRVLPIKLI